MTPQDLAVGLLDQDVQVELGLLPPGRSSLQLPGTPDLPAFATHLSTTLQDLAVGLLDQDVQVKSGLLPPGRSSVQLPGPSACPASDIDV